MLPMVGPLPPGDQKKNLPGKETPPGMGGEVGLKVLSGRNDLRANWFSLLKTVGVYVPWPVARPADPFLPFPAFESVNAVAL